MKLLWSKSPRTITKDRAGTIKPPPTSARGNTTSQIASVTAMSCTKIKGSFVVTKFGHLSVTPQPLRTVAAHLWLADQLRQLGDIGCNPSRFVLRQQLRR